MDAKKRFINFLLRTFLIYPYHIEYVFDPGFDPKRTDPYVLISNHGSWIDGLYLAYKLEQYPYPVINDFVYGDPFYRFLLTRVIHSIPKRKGQPDVATVRRIFDAVEQDQRGIMLFPEGDASYFGKENPVAFSTAKLLKKLKLDIIFGKTNGSYLSFPRWAERPIRGGHIEVRYSTLVTKEELETITTEYLYEKIVEAIRFNDFDWNRVRRHQFRLKHRAEGLERFLYVCPKCNNPQSIYTRKNVIYCHHCGEVARFDEFSFLQGLPFDNLVEWNELQQALIPELVKKPLKTSGNVLEGNGLSKRSDNLGGFRIELGNSTLSFANPGTRFEIPVSEIKNSVLTRKDELSFDYDGKTYCLILKDPMLFFDAIRHLSRLNP